MEIIEIECICAKCKNPFIVRRECHNVLEAEIQSHKLQNRRKPTCPACYRKEQQQYSVDMATEMGLPELIGRSEKQIQYAFSLRNTYILRHPKEIKDVKRELEKIQPDLIKEISAEMGLDEDECIFVAFKEIGMHKAYTCIAEVNAQRLIDILTKE